MDYYAMKRKQLQSLCKQHGIPANLRNTEMAHKLTLLLKEDEKLSEPVCKNLEENEGGIDSEVETKKVKKVKFSPENQTFYFVGTDNDSNSDCDYNPKKKQGRKRTSMVVKKVQVFENSRGLEHSHKIIDSPGRVTRSRAQKMDEGNAEAVFSPLPGKKKLTNRVKKVDSCDKPPPEVELIERVDSNAEHANLNGGLIQRQLRNRVVVSDDGGNSLVLRKDLVPRGSKKPKQNKGSDGDLLPTETYEENVPVGKGIKPEKVQKQCKGNVTKSGKTDLGGSRITRSRSQVGGNSSGVESKTDILIVQEKGQEVLQLKETCKGLDREHLRRKSAVPLKRSLEGDNLANEAVVPGKTLRRSKRKVARDRDSACGPLAETKLVGRSKKSKTKFVGKASGQEECELEEPSKDGQKIPVFQKGKELAKGDTRKRPRNIDLERASKVESSVERMEENVAVLPNGPLRRSRRKTTLFSSAAHDDREFRICEAAGTVKQSTAAGTVKQPVPDKGANVSQSLRRSSRNACEKILTEATGDMCGIANGVKKDGLVKQIQEPTYEKESSLIVHDSLNKSPQRRSSRILSKSGLVAPTGRTGIAAGKNKKSESRMPIIKEKVSFAKINSPLEENLSTDIRLNIPEASGNENNTDSCCSKGLERSSKQRKGSSKQRKGSSKQRKGSSKKRESAGRGQPVYDEVSTAYSIVEKAMDISGHLKDNQISESMKFQGISTVQKPQNVTEPLTNEMENSIPDNTTACDMDYHSYLSLNKCHTGHAIAVEQNPVECPDKFSNVVSSKFTCLSDGHSPTYQPDCEGECSNLLDLNKGLETDESLTVKTSDQRIDVVDDQLEGGSKVSVPEDQNLVQLDASGIDQPVLVEQVLEDHLTELGENKESDSNNAKSSALVEEICAFSSCDREEMVQVDVGSTAETSAETDGDIHLGRIVLSDTAVTLSKSSLVKEATDSCCSKEAVEKSSNKWESAAMGQPVCFEVSAVHSSIEKTMDISAHLKENQLSKYNNLQGVFTVQNAQNVMEPVTNVMENVMVDSGLNVPENATVRDMEDNYYPSLDRGDTGHIIAVEQTSEECMDKLSNVSFSRLTCLGDGHSPTCQPHCEGECTNLLDLKGLETDESWTVKTSHQKSDVVDDQLEDGSKASVPEDHNLVQLDARGINQPVLVEPVVEDHLTECDENNESDRNTAKSSEVVEETSEETVADIHLDRIVPSDTAVTLPKSSLLKQEGDQLENQFKSPVEGRSICEIDEALLYGSKNQNLSFDEVDYPEDDTVAASKIDSAIVVETESTSLSDCALAKMQHRNENILKEVTSEMKRHPSIASDDSMHMDGNADMDDNVGTLDGGMNSLNVSSKTEISSDNIGDFLVGDELADLSCCDHGIILGNAGASNSMAQTIPGLTDIDGIVGTESITQVKLCADNSCAKPQMYSGDLSGLNEIEGKKNNAEEKEMTYEDREGDQRKDQFKSPVEGRNIHERNQALLHGSKNQNLSFEEVDILEKHTVAANNTESSMDAVVNETESRSLSDFSLAKMRRGNENKSPDPSTMVVSVDSAVQERALNNVMQSVLLLDQGKYGDPGIHKEVSLEMKRHPSIASVDSMHTDGNADMDDNIGTLDGGINSVNVSSKTAINSDNTGDFLVRDELGDLCCCDHGIILGNAGVNNRVSQNEPGLADTDRIVDTESITQVNLSADNFCAKRQMHSGDLSGLNESEGRNNAEEKEMTYEDREGDQLKDQFESPVEGGIICERVEALLHGSQNQNLSFDEVDILEKHTVAANDIGSSMDALVDETQSGSLSDFALAKMQLGNENKSPGPSNMVVPVDSEVQERASNEVIQSVLQPDPAKCDDLELQGNEFGVLERVSGVKVVESLNVGINRTRTSQETEEVIDLLNLNDRDIISGDSKESPGFENLHPISMVKPETGVDCSADSPATDSSHGQCLLHQGEEATAETKALELNAASPLFSSYEIKQLFSDDKMDGFSKSYPDMSKVDSVIEDSEAVKKGKESAVGIAQVAAGQLTDHEHKSEDVMELKSTLEMGIHYPVGSPVTNFSSCGDIKRDEFQKLDAGLSKANLMNEVGEHVKEGLENDLGIAQVVAKKHSDHHGQRMADELLKSTHPPVSDGNTCVNERPKEKGIRPINQVFVDHEDIDEAGDIEYSNVWARTGKSVDDSEMSGSNPGAFDVPIDVPAANSYPNYLMQARSNVNPDVEDAKFSVESEIVSEQNVTADQCPISADSGLRKDNLESPRVRSWEADSDKSISISFAPRENKTDSLVPSPPKSFVNTADMKENFRNTKNDKVSNSAVKTLQPRPALKDLQKK
ncbi:hypothetical protein PRUPE_8G035200 [Prunus persica]|uniref:Uncharacterized protein n=1 Tax=Prunus persica TaxID=3760 RepID=A0A251MSC6_PRUPE|nr:uncharacterized protein LOC109950632 isoform X6 [Prunus persica]ONH90105.1 hypothetical protein PRUPE_8G035200 [Prunus persica]